MKDAAYLYLFIGLCVALFVYHFFPKGKMGIPGVVIFWPIFAGMFILSASIHGLPWLMNKLRENRAKALMLCLILLASPLLADVTKTAANTYPQTTPTYTPLLPSETFAQTPVDEMSPCEKQMAAILKEMKKKPAEKKVYEYRIVAGSNSEWVANEVGSYLRGGDWELYGSLSNNGDGRFAQAVIRVKP